MIWNDKKYKNQKIYILLLFEALIRAQKSLYGPLALFPPPPSVFVLYLYLYLYMYFYSYLYLYSCREIVIRSLRSPHPHHLYFIRADIYFLHFIFGIFYIWYLQLSIFSALLLWYLVLFIFQRYLCWCGYFEAQPDHEIIRELKGLMDFRTAMMVQLEWLKDK